MNGIDWAAIPVVCEMYGITNVEIFIAELKAIRDHLERTK